MIVSDGLAAPCVGMKLPPKTLLLATFVCLEQLDYESFAPDLS